jgi:hypothetical protein
VWIFHQFLMWINTEYYTLLIDQLVHTDCTTNSLTYNCDIEDVISICISLADLVWAVRSLAFSCLV